MTKKSDAPAIRFKGFSDAWEQRKFSDVVATRRGLTYKPSDIRKNGVRVLRSSNIAEDSFALSDEDVFVVREAVNIDCARANDILITAANGSSRLVGKHTIISGIPEESAVHGGFMLLGTTKEPHFVNASMGSSWYRRFIELFVAGGNGAIGNLNKNDLDNQEIAIPSEEEQEKIGSFFRQLDHLITLHQRECISFTGRAGRLILTANKKRTTSSWEQRKVGDLIEDYIEKTIVQNQYPVLTSSQQQGIVLQEDYFADRQVTTNDNIGYYVLPRGYFTYRSRSDTDMFVFNRNNIINKGIISYYYPVFLPKNCDSNFLLRRLNHGIRKQLSMAAEGTGQKVLAHNKFKNMVVDVPSTTEQCRIGIIFEMLDHLITLHQRQLFCIQSRKFL